MLLLEEGQKSEKQQKKQQKKELKGVIKEKNKKNTDLQNKVIQERLK